VEEVEKAGRLHLHRSREDTDSRRTQRVKREVTAWRCLSHPNVAEFLGIAYLQLGRPPGLVSRFMQRNDFMAYIGRHPNLQREKVRSHMRYSLTHSYLLGQLGSGSCSWPAISASEADSTR